MTTETFTNEQIDGWLLEISTEHVGRNYALAYKIGFLQGLTAVQVKMDDEIKRRKKEEQEAREASPGAGYSPPWCGHTSS
jgi:hypothetical protein